MDPCASRTQGPTASAASARASAMAMNLSPKNMPGKAQGPGSTGAGTKGSSGHLALPWATPSPLQPTEQTARRTLPCLRSRLPTPGQTPSPSPNLGRWLFFAHCAEPDPGTGEQAPCFVPVEDPEVPLLLGDLINPPKRQPLQTLSSVALFPGVQAEGSDGHMLGPQSVLQQRNRRQARRH